MKCVICKHGNILKGFSTITLEKNGATIIFQKVPALVCENCSEQYIDEEITSSVLKKARQILRSGVKVDIREYDLSAA